MNSLNGTAPGPTAVNGPASLPAVSVRLHTRGGWQIVEINGEMDLQVLDLLPILSCGLAEHVVFDLQGVTFMDACALGALVGQQVEITRSGGCMRLVAPWPVLKLLNATRTALVLPTFDTLERALHTPVPTGPERAA